MDVPLNLWNGIFPTSARSFINSVKSLELNTPQQKSRWNLVSDHQEET